MIDIFRPVMLLVLCVFRFVLPPCSIRVNPVWGVVMGVAVARAMGTNYAQRSRTMLQISDSAGQGRTKEFIP